MVQNGFTGTFTFAPMSTSNAGGVAVPGAYTGTGTITGASTGSTENVTLNLLPVNNGLTVLMQMFVPGDEKARVAVCQF